MNEGVKKVGLIPVMLMVAGNIMGSGVFLLPSSLAATGGIAVYGWLVTFIGALSLSLVFAKMSSIDKSPGGAYAYTRKAFGPFLGYQTNLLYWIAAWVGNIAIIAIGIGYLSYIFPSLKDPVMVTLLGILLLWFFVGVNILGPGYTARLQSVTTLLALIPIVGVAIFGWFWFDMDLYLAGWNPEGKNPVGAIESTLSVTLWSFIGIESASVVAGVVKNPKKNVPIATIGGVLIAAICYFFSTNAIMGMIPNAELQLSSSPYGDAVRLALGENAGTLVIVLATLGCLGSLGGWTLVAAQSAKAAADDKLFPSVFAAVNSRGVPVKGLVIVGVLMTLTQLITISPTATRQFDTVASMTVIFTVIPYIYTTASLVLLGSGKFGSQKTFYKAVVSMAFAYCLWSIVSSGQTEIIGAFIAVLLSTVLYALNFNRTNRKAYNLPKETLRSEEHKTP